MATCNSYQFSGNHRDLTWSPLGSILFTYLHRASSWVIGLTIGLYIFINHGLMNPQLTIV